MEKKLSRRAFIGLAATGAATAMITAGPAPAFAVTSAEKRAEAQAAREQLAEYQSQLDIASDNYFQALEEHDAAVAAMEEAQARIDAANAKIETTQTHLSARAVEMYKNGNTSYVDVLLGATSFTDFATTWDFLNQLNEEDAQAVIELKEARQEAQEAHDEYSRQEQIAQQKLEEAEQAKAEAEATVAQYDALVASLDAEAQALLEEEQAAAAAAQAAANQQAEAEAAAAGGGGGDGGGGGGGDTGGGGGGGSRPAGGYGSVVGAAASRVGCPYVWGAEGPDAFDCSGLVKWSYAQVGIYLSHSSGSQGFVGPTYPVSQAEPGDILWMPGHVGIYAGGGSSIEAMDYAYGVCYGNAYRFSHATHP